MPLLVRDAARWLFAIVATHQYVVLFAVVAIEEAGLPLPAPSEEVRDERPNSGRESANEDDLREIRQVAAGAESVERDHDVGGRGKRDAGLLDRDHEEQDDVLVLEHRDEK